MDLVDKRIVDFLGTVDASNLSELTIKSRARESQPVFKSRINSLEKRGYIDISRVGRTGRCYCIELNRTKTERFK